MKKCHNEKKVILLSGRMIINCAAPYHDEEN